MFAFMLIVIEILINIVYCACPDGCKCVGEVMTCSGIPLERPPPEITSVTIVQLNDTGLLKGLSILDSVHILNLSHLGIDQLDDLAEVHLPNLTTVILNHNILKHIDFVDFQWCPNVRRLDLSYCLTKTIEESTFENLWFIESLNLSQNDLTTFEASLYLPPSLIELDVSKNMLKQVPHFHKVTQLRRLLLCDNSYPTWPSQSTFNFSNLEELCLGSDVSGGIENFGDLASLKSLRRLTIYTKSKLESKMALDISQLSSLNYLRLDSCKLDNLDFLKTLTKLEQLEMVKIESVSTASFPSGALRNTSYIDVERSPNITDALFTSDVTYDALTTLLAPGCNVTVVPTRKMPRIQNVDLTSNPLNCDYAFVQHVVQQNWTFLYPERTICALPPEVSGWQLRDVMQRNSEAAAQVTSSGMERFLDRMGVTREQLFYVVIALLTLVIVCLTVLLILLLLKCCKYLHARRGVASTGWRGKFDRDREGACAEDLFFPRADNEYTFDNFNVQSDTIARSDNTADIHQTDE